MKFSIIIPVYNVEQFLVRCFESILKQSYTNYEVLVINDGSPDNSQAIIDEYVKKDSRIKSFIKENGGLSDARNYGVKHISSDTDYIFFFDSDDYIEPDLLLTLNTSLLNRKVDALKFRAVYVDDEGMFINDAPSIYFENEKGIDALIKLIEDDIFMTAWSYVYSKEYWLENDFKYPIGRVHEDIALTPIVLFNAESVTSLDFVGYNYVQRENSIMSQVSDDKLRKKADDTATNIKNLLDVMASSNNNDAIKVKFLTNYFARTLICYSLKLPEHLQTEFLDKIKLFELHNFLNKGRFRGRIDYLLIKYNLKRYVKNLDRFDKNEK